MHTYDILTIGHISLDYNIDYLNNQIVEVGGAVIYSSAAAYALGHSVMALTKLNPADNARLAELVLPKEDIVCLPSRASTSIRNQYFTADKERRACTCLAQGDAFVLADIPAPAKIYHLAGLIYGDFDGALIQSLAARGDVAVDVQALLRHADMQDGGRMFFEDWKEKRTYLPYIRYLKTDAAEAEILTGLTDRYEAARVLHGWGAQEVVITHNTEVIAYDGKTMCAAPLKPRNLSGRSGRGDTTFAAYLGERLHRPMQASLTMAAATVSYKMESPGPLRKTRAEVETYLKTFF